MGILGCCFFNWLISLWPMTYGVFWRGGGSDQLSVDLQPEYFEPSSQQTTFFYFSKCLSNYLLLIQSNIVFFLDHLGSNSHYAVRSLCNFNQNKYPTRSEAENVSGNFLVISLFIGYTSRKPVGHVNRFRHKRINKSGKCCWRICKVQVQCLLKRYLRDFEKINSFIWFYKKYIIHIYYYTISLFSVTNILNIYEVYIFFMVVDDVLDKFVWVDELELRENGFLAM